MLYFVECGFNDAQHEASWNNFYSHDKLPALISVQGFISSQRFHLWRGNQPPYLAIHDIVAAEVLQSAEYRKKGGGNFARWQAYISAMFTQAQRRRLLAQTNAYCCATKH